MKQDRIKVTCVTGALKRGGCETHLARVLPRLNPAEFDVRLFLLFERGELVEDLVQRGFTVHAPVVSSKFISFPLLSTIWKMIFAVYLLARLLTHFIVFRPHIAHFFLPAAYLIGFPIATLSRVKVRVMSRRSLNNYQRKNALTVALTKLEKTFHRSVDHVLGNSKAVVRQLMNDEHVPAQKITLIYNGVALSPPKADRMSVRNQWGISDDDVMIVVVANLIPYKGHADLIEALALLKGKTPYKCVMIGYDSGIQSTLEAQARTHNLDDQIIFTGSHPNLADFYHAADLGVLCSHEEGFSNTILEAMAAGLPLVVTDVGGNSEAVTHDENGLVVAPHNPKELSKAIDRLLDSESLRHRFGARSRDMTKEKFTLTECVSQYEAFYKKVAPKSNKSVQPAGESQHSVDMGQSPKISVVLPVYNAERYLREAVDSILTQTFTDFELILINDGSTDGSGDICRAYAKRDPRVVLIDCPTNGGLVSALNEGLAKARAPLIARMDADDIAMPERFACQYAHMVEHPNLAVLGSATRFIDETGQITGRRPYPFSPTDVKDAFTSGRDCPVAHSAVMMKRDVVLEVGGYRTAFTHAEDYELWLRLVERSHDIANLPQPLLNVRQRGDSVSAIYREQQQLVTFLANLSYHVRQAGHPDPLAGVEALHAGLLETFPAAHLNFHAHALLFFRRHIMIFRTTDQNALVQAWQDYQQLDPQVQRNLLLCDFLMLLFKESVRQGSWGTARVALREAFHRHPKEASRKIWRKVKGKILPW